MIDERQGGGDDTAGRPDAAWTRDSSRENLQLIAEGVTGIAGWGIAAIRVVREDDDLELVALAGADPGLIGKRTPLATLLAELELAERWGILHFIPHERLSDDDTGSQWVVPIVTATSQEPDAWHPLDMLLAPLYDDDGILRGTLSMDAPEDGRRPGPQKRRMLERYAEVAGRAVVYAVEREQLAQQVAMANTVKDIVRHASSQLNLIGLLKQSEQILVDGFHAMGLWVQTFGADENSAVLYSADGTPVELPPELVSIAETAAYHCWREQEASVIAPGRPVPPMLTPEQNDYILGFLETIGVYSILFAPLGAGPQCLGNLVLTRSAQDRDWSEVEASAVLDIGHDLGRAILNARTFERERALVTELQALGAYKGRLISTVAHELKNPLAAVVGHLELLVGTPGLPDQAGRSLAAMERSTGRLARTIESLLLLGKVDDPEHPLIAAPVDLKRIIAEVVDLTDVTVRTKAIDLKVAAPGETVSALGDDVELDQVVLNLISNAVKYTREGGHVDVGLRRVGEWVELTVADNGLGISEKDQAALFQEFFRSSNPEAVRQPGSGLGLAIVKRIVERHKGRIDFESTLGEGTTFRVLLPAA